MKKVSILSYGLGNISAFVKSFNYSGIECDVVSDPSLIKQCDRIVLPGVGSFDWAMDKLNNRGFTNAINDFVQIKQRPILGVCVGLQMMGMDSEEGISKGLSWINMNIKRFDFSQSLNKLPLPHIGWNNVYPINDSALFNDMEFPKFYFLHSFYVNLNDDLIISSLSEYGNSFCSSISYNNIHGVQFHPEKSHYWGQKLLSNFVNLT